MENLTVQVVPKPFVVYQIMDVDEVVRYVGFTEHKGKIGRPIVSAKQRGLYTEDCTIFIESFDDKKTALAREKELIHFYGSAQLLNKIETEAEKRARMAGTQTPEARERHAKAIRYLWKNMTPEQREARLAAFHAPESRAKQAETIKKTLSTPEQRERLSRQGKNRHAKDGSN